MVADCIYSVILEGLVSWNSDLFTLSGRTMISCDRYKPILILFGNYWAFFVDNIETVEWDWNEIGFTVFQWL